MRFLILAFLVLLVGVTKANTPEIGDVVATAEMVATFEHNEPNMVVSDGGHRRHWRIATPFVTFGNERFNLISDGSLGFFSSYERKEAQAEILLQAKHPGANTTLGCLMPGMNFQTGENNPNSPLFPFEPKMTCNLQVHGESSANLTAMLELEISSMQNDGVVFESTEKASGVVLRREDTRHLLKAVVLSVGNSSIETFPYPHKVVMRLYWNNVVPNQGVNVQFHVFIVASTYKDIKRDEWLLALFLTVAFLVVSIVSFVCVFVKYVVLNRDSERKSFHRAVLSTEYNRTNMTSLVSVEQLAAAQNSIVSQQKNA